MDYDKYNREERYICSHLFRLLHEPKDSYRGLQTFLGRTAPLTSFRIFSEVALIRDAFHARGADATPFMDGLVRLIMRQESVEECRLYSELPEHLRDRTKTHPKQIKHKAGSQLSPKEERVYGSLQAMFNAKPDLAICLESQLLVYEAKFTLDFDLAQLPRTTNIAEVWANLLYADLGFSAIPSVDVMKLGLSKVSPDISWEYIYKITESIYPEGDRTRTALYNAARFGS